MNTAQTHTQSIAAQTWTINHAFSGVPMSDVVVDVNGARVKMLPLSIKAISPTQMVITFSMPYAGTARLYGNVPGLPLATGANTIDHQIVYPPLTSGNWEINSPGTGVDGETLVFTVTRESVALPASIDWAITAPDPANNGVNGAWDATNLYAASGTINFATSEFTKQIMVQYSSGATYGLPAVVTVTLSNASDGTIITGFATGSWIA